ncbi:hypothetical protein [Nodularia sp. NIES-3585]|uniref:hypothetical protein n=1 Tax=Nodularia sp. NIES-3585 TaxID=1973477 RepID=UPI000B5CE4E7|nr:hypothetical protein [Nodularia sp. NIES-3585]GAX37347.1 hypothetical protein NIES3585_33900 [Nodularia sp. NIES-3585]
MSTAFRYWQLVRIDAAGNRQIQEITPAKVFFADQFPEYTAESDVPDAKVQRELLQLSRDANTDRCCLAERCLLCLISWQIEQVCWQIEAQFGNAHGFSCSDLLPYVLDDDGSLEQTGSYQSLGRKILSSFNPEKSHLATWINLKVKQHPELDKFLLELGLYRVTDWAILNDTLPKKLKQILTEFHSLTSSEIANFLALLKSYHEIYRSQRLQQSSLGICPQPTSSQLKQIALSLQSQIGQKLDNETVMAQLQRLATCLREYRIYNKSRFLPTVREYPVDIAAVENHDDNENEQMEFLHLYREQFLVCLEQALNIVVTLWVKQLQLKKGNKAQIFLTSLQLFHCQQMSMTEIAQILELKAQYAVTRLLNLKEFRADVQREFVKILYKRVTDLAQNYSHPERLKKLEQQLASIIHTQSYILFRDAEIQSRTVNNNSQSSLFSETLCRYLDLLDKQT